jgi:H/ACA ribonucleoprotein complex subunit 4
MSKEVAVVKKGSEEDEYTIKPQATTPALDTSSWPLLLKNYDKRESPRDSQLQHHLGCR